MGKTEGKQCATKQKVFTSGYGFRDNYYAQSISGATTTRK